MRSKTFYDPTAAASRKRVERWTGSLSKCGRTCFPNNSTDSIATSSGTWITPAMEKAYVGLHRNGHAHSIECWLEDKLVGGLYGVAIGGCFFGESMFSHADNASKVAAFALTRAALAWGIPFIDCQVTNPHLLILGSLPAPSATAC